MANRISVDVSVAFGLTLTLRTISTRAANFRAGRTSDCNEFRVCGLLLAEVSGTMECRSGWDMHHQGGLPRLRETGLNGQGGHLIHRCHHGEKRNS